MTCVKCKKIIEGKVVYVAIQRLSICTAQGVARQFEMAPAHEVCS